VDGFTVTCTGGVIDALAVAVLLESAALVTVTVTVCGLLSVVGAEYKPLLEIVPTAGLTDHVTAVLVVPVTAAVNCCVCPATRFAKPGDTLAPIDGCSATTAKPLRTLSAGLAAVTATPYGSLIVSGAVYSPLTDIVPALTLPPATPSTSQISSSFAVPGVANCCLPPAWRVTEAGDRVTTRLRCAVPGSCSAEGRRSGLPTELGPVASPVGPVGDVWPGSREGTIQQEAKTVRRYAAWLILRIR
jgi:hypothetical protein